MDPIGPRAGVWKHEFFRLCLSAAKSLRELTDGCICIAVATIQPYLAIVDLSTTCLLLGSLTYWFILRVKVIITEKIRGKHIYNSAGQDRGVYSQGQSSRWTWWGRGTHQEPQRATPLPPCEAICARTRHFWSWFMESTWHWLVHHLCWLEALPTSVAKWLIEEARSARPTLWNIFF